MEKVLMLRYSQKGIGFINIYNRVDAFGGEMELISSPGNGCSLQINFPAYIKQLIKIYRRQLAGL